MTLECCDEVAEDCIDGMPKTCNTECANLLLPYVEDCQAEFDDVVLASFKPIFEMCQATIGPTKGIV